VNTALQVTLLHSLWEGALIAVILAAILQMCRSGSARLRYALACAALFAIPLAFGITFWLFLPPARPQVSIPATFPIARLLELPSTDSSAPGSSPSPTTWLVPLWMTGVLGFYLYSLAGWFSAQRLRRVGVCAAAPVWQQRLGSLATRLRLSRQVILLESCLASTPVVIGAFRPVILVPLGILSGLPIGQVEAILIEAALSFLGVGVPAQIPSWGNMMAEGRNFVAVAFHIILYPGILLALTVLAINLLGDGLRDALDPRLARQL